MRIAVLGGAGAMGGIFGGFLARAGEDVTLIDVSRPAVEAINRDGLVVEQKDGTVATIPVKATTDPASVGPVDLIMNFVKCYHTEGAINSAKPMLGPDTAILTLQNGWGNADRIAAIVGRERVMVGLTYASGTLVGPGRVRNTGVAQTVIGELDGSLSPRLERAADALRRTGIDLQVSQRIVEEIWKKLVINVCSLPTAALLHFTADELPKHEGSVTLMRGLLREMAVVAKAEGIELDEEERWAALIGILQRAVGGRASMLQDVEAHRQTEIDVVNGAIVAAGKRHGIATPLNDAMVWMVKAYQEEYLAKKA
ncbi:MAG: 2-dehydropantoate 2-reductase [Rhizobiales bacterium]|nr:2-dehydropantoate 2-reductase [Hyphomicrobiales bacterium]